MGKIMIPLEEEMPRSADVVIIGGGIVGVSTAFFCSKAGLKTVVVEKRAALGTLTTSRSTECFRAQFNSPADIALMLGSISVFAHFSDVVGVPEQDIHFRPQGYLYATTDTRVAREYECTVAEQHAAGLKDVELLGGDEARARFPYVGPEVVAARYRAGDGWRSVHEMLYGCAKGSQARFLLKTQVLRMLRDAQGVCGVETNRGAISSRIIVVAAGPFSSQVAHLAEVDLPLTVLRRHRLAILRCDLVPRNAPSPWTTMRRLWRPEACALMGRALRRNQKQPKECARRVELPCDCAGS